MRVMQEVRAARRQTIGDLLRRSARREPDKLAIVYRELRQTYAELDAAVDRTAAALSVRGVAKGDRVMLHAHNSHGFVVACLALARVGAVMVPVNFMLGAGEVAFIARHAGVSAAIVEDALLEVATAALDEAALDVAPRVVISDGPAAPPDGWESLHDLMTDDGDALPDVDIDDDDPVAITYTSGTESRPKGAVLTSRGLIAQFVSCIVDGEMTRDDVVVHPMPLYHCAQLYCFLLPGLYLGTTNVVLPGADPAEILRTVAAESISLLFVPPTVWIGILRHPSFDATDRSSLRKGYYGASPMPVEVLHELGERLPGVRLFNFYGQTEMAPLATLLRPEDQVRKAGSAGRAALNVETRVVDADDRPVAAGTVGEIVHRSPHAMLGYHDDPGKTAEAFRGGWFHSGDLGVLDEEGYLYVVDRKKDMIKSGGENVASREVEEAIYEHPAVQEVAIFGVPHPTWIEAVAAAVVVREGEALTEADVIAFCRGRLAGFKTPKHVVIVDELPKNASGKIVKRDLRERFADLAGTTSR
jgi:fatty-acyl-CoA synthase